MIRVALVEDSPQDRRLLREHLDRYAGQSGEEIRVEEFSDGLAFLERLKGNFDVIFMDVEMPHLNGIDAARRLRESDESVSLIFVTNMAQYAICGYEVNAIDYMLKPVRYANFADKMSKAVDRIRRIRDRQRLLMHTRDDMVTILAEDVNYAERDGNYIVFHTDKGDFRERGAVSDLFKRLEGLGFARCTAGCLVNLSRVSKVEKDTVVVRGIPLPLARPQKKEFRQRFLAFWGEG